MYEIEMVNLTIDDQPVMVPKGTTVYTAAKKLGIDIPIFCYLDRMPPFGACRMCFVEVEKMPKPQTSCTLIATEGMVVKTQSKMAVQSRNDILELLLINHPLDCPICDRGGECPLQDHTIKYGPGLSRFYEEKRRFKKPIPLGPVLMLDRERCIVCARCTRFGDVLAGDHALEFIERGYKTEVGTPEGGTAESKFIGNTIMICPVGALTSRVYRFRARPWDNDPTNSTCTLCPVGCSMIIDSRDGEIMRTRSYENREVNDIWLCDKGWFGYEFSSNEDRLQQPLVRRGGTLEPVSWDEALDLVADKIKAAKAHGKLAGLGGNPLTVEENYLFQKLMRQGAGVNNLDHRVGMPIFSLDEEGLASGMEMSIGECEDLSLAYLLGIDLTEEFPVIWLRLRQAINKGATAIFLGHFRPEISPFLAKTIVHAPGKELETMKEHLSHAAALAQKGKKGALFVGSQYLDSPHRRAILAELVKLQKSLPNLKLNILEGRGNSMGARLAGMRPDLGPLGASISKPGLNAVQVLESASRNGWDFLYVAGANPAAKYPSKLWKEAREKLGFMVVQDLFLTETAKQADLVLPTLSFVEKKGRFINIEGRVQKLNPGKEIPNNLYSDAEIFEFIAEKLNLSFDMDHKFVDALKMVKVPLHRPEKVESGSGSVSKEAHKKDGDLAATFEHKLFDHGVRMKHDPNVVKLAKEPIARVHPNDGMKLGIQDGGTVRLNDVVSMPIKFDDTVSEGTIVLPLGFPELGIQELGTNLLNGLGIRVNV